MNELFIPDVGDGLAAGIISGSGNSIEIDCGSQQAPEKSFAALKRVFPRTFVLSHFHTDHYNGLFHADPSFDIRHVFFPRLPVFKGREEFLNCLLAMANRRFGGRSGSPEADLISEIQRISRRPVGWGGLSSGDKVDLKGMQIDVLWPPRTLIDGEVLKVIRNAINDFGEAKKKDKELRKLYDAVEKAEKAQMYLREEEGRSEPDKAKQVDVKLIGYRPLPTPEPPPIVARANKSLRLAANHLSLAFHAGSRLLFLGDLERNEIKQVVAELQRRHRTNFLITITPHHGTHSHADLLRLRSILAISSLGSRLIRYLKPEFKTKSSFARLCLSTHRDGDIHVVRLSGKSKSSPSSLLPNPYGKSHPP